MRRSVSIYVALAALLLVFHASHAAAQNTGRISGVVNDENGKPIKAATVTAENLDTNQAFTATTDEKGRFTIIGLRPATWRFTAQAPGHFPEQGSMAIRVGTPNPPIGFALKATGAPGGGVLGGASAKDLQNSLASADALFNQRRWDDAIAAYKSLLDKTPSLSVINLQIAAAYINKKDYDGAIAAYSDLLKVDPSNDKATVGIAKARVERGDRAGAEDGLAKAAGAPTAGREIFYALGDLKFDSGETDAAITWYEKATSADPSWGKPLYKLGLAAQKKGDRTGAAAFLNKVIVVDPISPEAGMAKSTLEQLNR